MSPFYIFDIDGVVTAPFTKKPHPYILSFIASQLQKKHPIALATGRSISWIQENILVKLEKKIQKKEFLDFLFISGEKGAVSLEFILGKEQR